MPQDTPPGPHHGEGPHEDEHDDGAQPPGWQPDDDVPASPPRGDAIEIPGPPPEVEYELVRTSAPWTTPLVIGIVTLIAVFVAARAAMDDDVEQIRLSTAPQGAVPSTLADGATPPPLPEALENRFDAPVVMTRSLDEVPEDLVERCRTPFTSDRLDESALTRLDRVVDAGRIADVRVGPDVVGVLRVGPADSPPEWPDEWSLSCLGRPDEDADAAWVARPPRLAFLRDGDRGASDDAPGVVARLARVPSGAAWMAQERDGWWLAGSVDGGSWAHLSVPSNQADLPVRVVFFDADGEVVEDRRLVRPPPAGEPQPGTEDEPEDLGTIDAGAVDDVLDAVDDEPVRACADDLPVCVWITRVGTELEAHAAYGTHPLDVPPFGELGWCPEAEGFQGTVTRSTFEPDGTWRAGVAPRDADGFGLRFSDGRALVDLDRRSPGEPSTGEADVPALCRFDDGPIGSVPDGEELEPL